MPPPHVDKIHRVRAAHGVNEDLREARAHRAESGLVPPPVLAVYVGRDDGAEQVQHGNRVAAGDGREHFEGARGELVAEERDAPEHRVDARAEGALAFHVYRGELGLKDGEVEVVQWPEGHVQDGVVVVEELVQTLFEVVEFSRCSRERSLAVKCRARALRRLPESSAPE